MGMGDSETNSYNEEILKKSSHDKGWCVTIWYVII
jgi:hypothetical protein